ncbi:DUF4138 domain-containing protein [Costertonia aggregata]|nr:DUF4138 domain-containing protein [Costertonia aggregata]
MGTLTARKGPPSNLTVITENGNIYSFTLTYETEVANFTFILSEDQAIGTIPLSAIEKITGKTYTDVKERLPDNKVRDTSYRQTSLPNNTNYSEVKIEAFRSSAKSTKIQDKTKMDKGLYDVNKKDYYGIFCENNYVQPPKIKDASNTVNLIKVQLNNILKDRSELYFVLEIKNNSEIDYKVKRLRFFVKSRKNNSKLEIEQLYLYNLFKTISAHSKNNLVFVSKKFQLAADQKVYVLLEEEDGQRSVLLPLDIVDEINRI